MPGYYTYYIDVWDEHLKQLHSHGEFKTQQAARQAAVAQLEDSGLPYKRADVNIMHYNGADYNDRNCPTFTVKPKQKQKEKEL